jgi:serine/threonine protein kinase
MGPASFNAAVMLEDPSALQPGALLAGKFRVVRCLGMGGMGSVYEIEHELTKHRRALKLLHPAMAAVPGVVERFLREASAAGRVGNPHIVETFDAGTLDTGEPYLVMEILRGQTLTDRIERGPMPLDEMVDLIGQACDGIQAAHEAGIVHRDLKPDNLFVVDVGGRPFVKILDFGISKFDPGKTGGMALTQEGAALGTPYYMSPEQIRGEINLDARADVYALGVILYECAAGCRPFEADALTQLAVLIHTGRPAPLAERRKNLPPGFVDLVMRAMAADRAQRTQSSRALRQELERFGTISFRGHTGTGPSPSLITAPERSVAAHSLATSAAGVSVLQASGPLRKRGQRAPIIVGFAILGVVAVVLAFVLRSSTTPGPEAAGSAIAAGSTEKASGPAAQPGPVAPPAASSAAGLVASAPSGKPSPAGTFPVVVPTLTAPTALVPAQTGNPASPSGPAAPPPVKARRTDERGLAKDNPFR